MRKKTREGKEGDRFKILLKKEEKTRTTKRRANSLGNSKPALSGEFQTGGDKHFGCVAYRCDPQFTRHEYLASRQGLRHQKSVHVRILSLGLNYMSFSAV